MGQMGDDGRCQPAGTRAQPVNLRILKSSNNSETGRSSPQEQLKNLETKQTKNTENVRLQAQQAAQEKQREANCSNANSNLKVLRSNGRIRIDEDGEQRYLSPEEIAEQRQNFEALANENCGAESPQDI